ncbi:hypothetical protein [Chlorobium phaeobacteroides]|jgi:hypothetical protein|uniref:Uncharacterized protein n=1 Tax=Chlorobium phaeobacteroides (strain DSM 266 / SMG 266 / 2430) TaxID=290317 RepID=A1BEY1_CHLPD|nr:hypothetical protein [Chlorobium phaeobacteroides]ABL64958.1 conserved hypothetical protein [Chlorobium phaeobacteroides DSM 266]MBV5329291.1 hypothetical protein [Chlorobium sp.]
MKNTMRPLGTVMQLLEELGHEVTYAYEDLVFVNHSDFLLQFADTGNVLNLFFNYDCNKHDADAIETSIIPAGDKKGLSIINKGLYSVSEQPDETLQIQFF